MSRPCRVCIHEKVGEIDSLLSQGWSPYQISPKFNNQPSPYAITRHLKAEHHLKKIDLAPKGDSTEALEQWIKRADDLYTFAEEKHDIVKMNSAVAMSAKFMELLMKKRGELLTDSARREQEVKRGKEALPDDDRVPLDVLDRILNSVEGRKVT
jgi:hypothetical protein